MLGVGIIVLVSFSTISIPLIGYPRILRCCATTIGRVNNESRGICELGGLDLSCGFQSFGKAIDGICDLRIINFSH